MAEWESTDSIREQESEMRGRGVAVHPLAKLAYTGCSNVNVHHVGSLITIIMACMAPTSIAEKHYGERSSST